jgi:hypothetical protein
LLDKCKAALGIRGKIQLFVQKEPAGPALIFPNRILMPPEVLSMDPHKLNMSMIHELTHYKRKDHILGLALLILRTVYWFNPFVRLAVRQIRGDIETACDSDVVKHWKPDERNCYAHTVLSLFGQESREHILVGMALGKSRKNIEQRIRGIYMKNKSKTSIKVITVLLAFTLGIGCFTTALYPATAEAAGGVQNVMSHDEQAANGQAAAAGTIPERFEADIEKGNLSVSANAAVNAPEEKNMPVVRVKSYVFSIYGMSTSENAYSYETWLEDITDSGESLMAIQAAGLSSTPEQAVAMAQQGLRRDVVLDCVAVGVHRNVEETGTDKQGYYYMMLPPTIFMRIFRRDKTGKHCRDERSGAKRSIAVFLGNVEGNTVFTFDKELMRYLEQA